MSHRTVIKSPPTYSLPNAPLLCKLTLYPFQQEAIEKMRWYYFAYTSEAPASIKKTRRSGLVYMPTGTGKTAVIAALSQCVPEVLSVLVLSPRIALRDQLFRELKNGIFKKLSLPPGAKLKPVYCLKEKQKDINFINDLPREAVIVSTIQKLQTMQKNQRDFYHKLVDQVDLIIFDEGHYEPALHWSDTVRRIKKPRMIFTATPFRNDLKNFDIDPDHAYVYSFHKAVAQHYIRNVEITDVTPRTPLSPPEFVDLVIKFYRLYTDQRVLHKDARIIIRCDDASQIGHIADAFIQKSIKCIAVHETFQDNTENGVKWKHVPNPRETNALVWIHQFKLIEGIDDWRFQLLAFFGVGLDSARPLIQQIGRIIRNPKKEVHSKAYVLDTSGGILKQQWSGYLEHDIFIERNGVQALDTKQRFKDALEEAQLPIYYLDGEFCTPFSFKTFKPETDIKLPRKVNIYHKLPNFNMNKLVNAITQQFKREDRIIAPPEKTDDRGLIVSIRFTDSPFLNKQYFPDMKLCLTLIRLAGDYICFFDSESLSPSFFPGFGKPVEPQNLRRLLACSESCQIRQVSLINSRMNPDTIQRRSLLTYTSMERTPLAFDDPNYVCTSAEACIDRNIQEKNMGIRRYIGFTKARLSDGSWTTFHPFSEYELWLDKIVGILKSKATLPSINGLTRYAAITRPPLKTDPMTVVLNTYAVRGLYITSDRMPVPVQPVDIYQIDDDISVKGNTFTARANGEPCQIRIDYDMVFEKYKLISTKFDRMYHPIVSSTGGIIDYLNDEQAFRVVPEDHRVIYAAGAFHDPKIGLGDEYADKRKAILSTIKPFPVFESVGSEKGRNGVLPGGSGWEKNSLFSLIDRIGGDRLSRIHLSKKEEALSQYFQDVELLVCDDMGTELADFIMLQSMPADRLSVVFIHCKALAPDQGTKLSATKLADVCSQAIKNLGELDNFSDSLVTRAEKWSDPWDGGKLGQVETRIRKSPASGQPAWDMFRKAVEDPNTRRETWLFLGNILSKQEFESRLSHPATKPRETLQVLYELYSTVCTVRSRDSGLYIFCNE